MSRLRRRINGDYKNKVYNHYDPVSDEIVYVYYFTTDFMNGIQYLRDLYNCPIPSTIQQMPGKAMFLNHTYGDLEMTAFCMDLLIRGMNEFFIYNTDANSKYLFRLFNQIKSFT